MRLVFGKYEGIGNDFVVVDEAQPAMAHMGLEQLRALTDRHLGVGGDGVLLVGERDGLPSMRVINADGSIPEMCGNGLRCVALHLARAGRVRDGEIIVATDAGPHLCTVSLEGDDAASVEVVMRAPSLAPADVPTTSDAPMVDAALDVDGLVVHGTAVSMGNPHLVLFEALDSSALATLGPRLERDPRFPSGVNVGFARPRSEGGFDLDVFERGAGWTQACGTGACAAAVAAVETGRATRDVPVEVKLPGGWLTITVGAPGEPVRMRGSARHVFDGSIAVARGEA